MGKGILNTLKQDSKEAAYRVAGTQVMKVAKDGLLSFLHKKGVNDKRINAVANFIETDVGSALLSTCVGFTFSYVPPFKNDKRAQTLAKEFRVGGMALAGNLLADTAIQELIPKFSGLLDNLPIISKSKQLEDAVKMRIAEDDNPAYEASDEHAPLAKSAHKLDAFQ